MLARILTRLDTSRTGGNIEPHVGIAQSCKLVCLHLDQAVCSMAIIASSSRSIGVAIANVQILRILLRDKPLGHGKHKSSSKAKQYTDEVVILIIGVVPI